MPEDVNNPHDKLFKTVFSEPEDASSFLKASLPERLVKQIDWTTLRLMPKSFVDEIF